MERNFLKFFYSWVVIEKLKVKPGLPLFLSKPILLANYLKLICIKFLHVKAISFILYKRTWVNGWIKVIYLFHICFPCKSMRWIFLLIHSVEENYGECLWFHFAHLCVKLRFYHEKFHWIRIRILFSGLNIFEQK